MIKLMADYQCYPLWEASPGAVGNIEPSELPISCLLKDRLMTCAAKFDATLDMDDPANSGFESERAAEAFRNEGDALVEQLQNELGAAYVVTAQIRGTAKRGL